MDWFYAINNRRLGPVSDQQLAELRRTGEVHDDTLVWRDGMKDWQPLREAQALMPLPAGHRMCGECRRFFPQSELVQLNRGWICADCKPRYLQKMTEGLAPTLGVGELWRHGRQLIFHAETPFPDRCIRCNAPANGYRQRCHLFWAPSGRLVLVPRRYEILVGLCERHRRMRSRITAGCWIGATIGAITFIFGLIQGAPGGAAFASGGFMIGVFAASLAGASRTLVTAIKITDGVVRLRGVGKAFLAELPEWPGDR